jgi:hypothetical protein
MSDDELGQSVRFREFVTSRDELRARLHSLELEQARLSASLMHLPTKVDELVASVNALANKVAQNNAPPQHTQEHDSAVLALHRALDGVNKGGGAGGFERLLLLGLVAVVSFMTARFFIGG